MCHLAYVPHWLPYPIAVIGTVVIIAVAIVLYVLATAYAKRTERDSKERYRRKNFFTTIVVIGAALIIAALWAKNLKEKGTFLGLLGAGLAVAMREPLLSIAGRLAVFSGHMYTAGDRIELQGMTGDVIDIGFFYTRMLEIGSWIHGDQYSGRILLIPNSMIFGTPISNYTQHLSCIWDEVSLPITYGSDMEAAIRILTDVGSSYTEQFLKTAQKELDAMKKRFLVPHVEFQPTVFVKVTSNWLDLTMRYVVEAKQRRSASSFLYQEIFKRVQKNKQIQIASETMDLTVHQGKAA
jgi:small-conductance mechanosensitive channel